MHILENVINEFFLIINDSGSSHAKILYKLGEYKESVVYYILDFLAVAKEAKNLRPK